jgi:hydroxyacylglutathione hydrolase
MLIERFFVPGLAHVSYLLASGDEAVVVDPERNVDGYLAYLARNELKLRGIFLTHPHADFVAGHAELAARSGAGIFISGRAPATFVHRDLKEGDRLALGNWSSRSSKLPVIRRIASAFPYSNRAFPLLSFPVTLFSPVT